MLFAELILELLRRNATVLVAGTTRSATRDEPAPVEWLILRLSTSSLCVLPCLVVLPARPELVVLFAFLRIRQDLVRFGDLLEPGLRFWVARIDVRVILPGQLAIGRPNFLIGGRLRHAQEPVVVLEFHPLTSRVSLNRRAAIVAVGGAHRG